MKMTFCALIAISFLAGVSLTACEDSDTPSSASESDAGGGNDESDAGASGSDASSGAEAGGESDGGACNDLVNAAPEALSGTFEGAPPALAGGTIVDGTYFLTEFDLYDPNGKDSMPTPSGLKTTLVIAGKGMDSVMDVGDGQNHTFSETFTVSGNTLLRTLTCPKPGPDLDATYDVDGDSLIIAEVDPKAGTVGLSIYTKQ